MMEALSEAKTKDLLRHPEMWMKYLDTASRMCMYSFPDQVMIYAQRPNAIACASFKYF